MGDWYVRSAARAYGLFARDEVAYQRKELLGGIDAAIENLVESGDLVRAEILGAGVDGAKGRPYWVDSSLLRPSAGGKARAASSEAHRLYILSPFDPFIIVRKRFERLFGVRYAIECYFPEAKRSFGYFALPLLFAGPSGTRFAGLMDAKADRKGKQLIVNRLSLERPSVARSSADAKARKAERDALLEPLTEAIAMYAQFNGALAVSFGLVEAPGGATFAKRLRTAVGKRL